MAESNIELAARIIQAIPYVTIATVTEHGEPWNTPVFTAFDSELRFYWSSSPKSTHSQNIEQNHQVFLVIYDSTAQEGAGVGVYMKGTADILADTDEIKVALGLLGKRRGRPFEHAEKFIGVGPQRIYRATPIECWINDADKDSDGDFIRDFRTKVDKAELTRLLS